MSSNAISPNENLFSSLISDIKSYNGMDPLLPWLRGIRKMKETLTPQLLKEKLPRFLQKCAETFISDRRYSNDLRYLRVWLQLMDFVDEPRTVLKTMEMNRIGMKKSLFYQAYALYYEKMKKFDAAEKIYHLGVQNLAEPFDELQKSYEQFLHRMERQKNKRVQLLGGKANKGRLNHDEGRSQRADGLPADMRTKDHLPATETKFANIGNKIVPVQSPQSEMHMKESNHNQDEVEVRAEQDKSRQFYSDDTAVDRFVDTAILGKSNAEDARHHGLVEPTVNTKEAMNAINSMFREPFEPLISSRTSRNQPSICSSMNTGLMVFNDENLESQQTSSEVPSLSQLKIADTNQPLDESFEIYVDGEETVDVKEKAKDTSNVHASVFAIPNDLPSECFKELNSKRPGLREDTVVHRFVGSTISEEPEVENVWHHGLVDPTVNLKEAMKDINSMFGKPIEFTRKSRLRKHDKAPDVKGQSGEFLILPDDEPDESESDVPCGIHHKPLNMASKGSPENLSEVPDVISKHSGFLILPDDELDSQQESSMPSSCTRNGSDLFEKTVCTREAMDEINKLFSMPMDF